MFLHRASNDKVFRGTGVMFELQFGKVRPMRWCERKGLVHQVGGRMEITKAGRVTLSQAHHSQTEAD